MLSLDGLSVIECFDLLEVRVVADDRNLSNSLIANWLLAFRFKMDRLYRKLKIDDLYWNVLCNKRRTEWEYAGNGVRWFPTGLQRFVYKRLNWSNCSSDSWLNVCRICSKRYGSSQGLLPRKEDVESTFEAIVYRFPVIPVRRNRFKKNCRNAAVFTLIGVC